MKNSNTGTTTTNTSTRIAKSRFGFFVGPVVNVSSFYCGAPLKLTRHGGPLP